MISFLIYNTDQARKFSPVEEESPQEISQHLSDSEEIPSDNTSIREGGAQTSPLPRGRSALRKGRRGRSRKAGGSQDSEGDTSPDTRLESEVSMVGVY